MATLEGKGWFVVEKPGASVRLKPLQDDGILRS